MLKELVTQTKKFGLGTLDELIAAINRTKTPEELDWIFVLVADILEKFRGKSVEREEFSPVTRLLRCLVLARMYHGTPNTDEVMFQRNKLVVNALELFTLVNTPSVLI